MATIFQKPTSQPLVYHSSMKPFSLLAFVFLISTFAVAHAAPFDGTWTIDLRSPAQKKLNAECGSAKFVLKQDGDAVSGDYQMAAVGCGRINEGGKDTVRGTARGNSANLTVTSGRNGTVVRGRAMRAGSALRWKVTEQVKSGEPEGDSGLILEQGTFERARR